MAVGIQNQTLASVQGNPTLMAQFPTPPRPTAWALRRPKTNRPAQIKLDNRAQRKGYLC